MREAIASGVAEKFVSREAAEKVLGKTHPSPLGNLRKPKPDGQWKDRVIHDYKTSLVNLLVRLYERVVLPRPVDLGRDIAALGALGGFLALLVLDFEPCPLSLNS